MDKAVVFGTTDGGSIPSKGASIDVSESLPSDELRSINALRNVVTKGHVLHMSWYIYIAQFKFGLYTGITKNVQRRIAQHNKGIGAKSLKGKGPITLVYSEVHETHELAAKREFEIKGWKREKKLKLIETGP